MITFTQDNFEARRASQNGAGVAYDPESLLTGDEIARGFDYGDSRSWPNEETRQLAHRGFIPVDLIPVIAPRVKRAPSEDWDKFEASYLSGPSDWHSLAAAEIDNEPRVIR